METHQVFDGLGRLASTRDLANGVQLNNSKTYSYAWVSTIGGTTGGYRLTTTRNYSGGSNYSIDDTDYFGRNTVHRDEGGHVFNYSYNYAGSLHEQTSSTGQDISYRYYANGRLMQTNDRGVNSYTQFDYDVRGNKTREQVYNVNEFGQRLYRQDTKANYDAANRLQFLEDERYTIRYTFDANGNIRSMTSEYKTLDENSKVIGSGNKQPYWYTYDKLNRFVITKGVMSSDGVITRGRQGTQIDYVTSGEGANSGRRLSAVNPESTLETYAYDANGHLSSVKIRKPNTSTDILAMSRINDAEGNVLEFKEYAYLNSQLTRNELTTYDAYGRVTKTVDSATGVNLETRQIYNADGSLARREEYEGTTLESETRYEYELWDSYKQKTVRNFSYSDDQDLDGTSLHEYNVNGHLRALRDIDGERKMSYVNDHAGRILQRVEIGATKAGTFKNFHNYYYFNGMGIGDFGKGISSSHNYAESLSQAQDAFIGAQAGLKQNESNEDLQNQSKAMGDAAAKAPINAVTSADFDNNYSAIKASSAAESYTVQRTGEDLKSIARALFGDSNLWYVIADANALSPTEQLTAGQILTIPQSVTNIGNTSTTFKPFDPSETLGNVAPTLQDPPAPKDMGFAQALVMIVTIIVAVIMTVITAGAASPLLQMAAAVAVATVSSVAGQLVAMATGLQDSFDWGAVGEAAVMAVLTFGMGNMGVGTGMVNTVTNAMAQQALTATARELVAVSKGEKFSWGNVAKSAVAGGLSAGVMAGVGKLGAGDAIGVKADGTVAPTSTSVNFSSVATTFVTSTLRSAISQRIESAVFKDDEHKFSWGNAAAAGLRSALDHKFVPPSHKEPVIWGKGSDGEWVNPLAGYKNLFSTAKQDFANIGEGIADFFTGDTPQTGISFRAPTTVSEEDAQRYSPVQVENPDITLTNPAATEIIAKPSAIVASKGQGISSLIGTSNPKAIGDFIKLNGLKNDVIQEGREYRLPSGENLGNNAALGQAALDAGNARKVEYAAADYDRNGKVNTAERERYIVENPTPEEAARIARRDAALAEPMPLTLNLTGGLDTNISNINTYFSGSRNRLGYDGLSLDAQKEMTINTFEMVSAKLAPSNTFASLEMLSAMNSATNGGEYGFSVHKTNGNSDTGFFGDFQRSLAGSLVSAFTEKPLDAIQFLNEPVPFTSLRRADIFGLSHITKQTQDNFENATQLSWDFVNGTGDDTIFFGSETPAAKEMLSSMIKGNATKDYVKARFVDLALGLDPEPFTNYKGSFGLTGAFVEVINANAYGSQVGSALVEVDKTEDGHLAFGISNTLSLKSINFGLGGTYNRDLRGEGGNVNQYIYTIDETVNFTGMQDPKMLMKNYGAGIKDFSNPVELLRPIFSDELDATGSSKIKLTQEQVPQFIEIVKAIENPIDRAKVIRAVYTHIFENDKFATWFGLGAMAANVVVGGEQQTISGGLTARVSEYVGIDTTFDEDSNIAMQMLAEGNLAVFESQFGAYVAYKNGGVAAVKEFASNLKGGIDMNKTLVSGYTFADQSKAAYITGDIESSNEYFGRSLVQLALHEQGGAVLQAIYDTSYSTINSETGGQYVSTGGNALRDMNKTVKTLPFGIGKIVDPVSIDVAGSYVSFKGDNPGNYEQRWGFVSEVAAKFMEIRNQPNGTEKIRAHNRNMLNYNYYDTAVKPASPYIPEGQIFHDIENNYDALKNWTKKQWNKVF